MLKWVIFLLILVAQASGTQNPTPIGVHNADQIVLVAELYRAESERQISDIAFSPDGTILAFIDTPVNFANGRVTFYETKTLALSVGDAGEIIGNRLVFNHQGNRLIVGTETGEVTIFNAQDLTVVEILDVSNGGGVQAIAVSPDDNYIAITANSTQRIGDYAFYLSAFEGEPILHLSSEESVLSFGTAFHPSGESVAFAGTRLEGASPNMGVRVWNIADVQQTAFCGDYQPFTDDMVITHDGSDLIYPAIDGIRLWNMQDCTEKPDSWHLLAPQEDNLQVTSLVLHPTEPILAVGYGRRTEEYGCCVGLIQLWDIETGGMIAVLQDFANDTYSTVSTLAFSPDGTLLASGGTDGTVRLWGVPAGE